jgi:TolB-like protein
MNSGVYPKLSAIFLAVSALVLTACGYQVGGQASLLPKDARTIAIAPFSNASINYTLSNYLAASVSREFIARTRYRIVKDLSKADLILQGSVANMVKGGTLYDNTTGRTTAGSVYVLIQYKLSDRAGKVLIAKPSLEFRQAYEISVNPAQYFDESEAAEQRLSDDVAKSIVSSILEQF